MWSTEIVCGYLSKCARVRPRVSSSSLNVLFLIATGIHVVGRSGRYLKMPPNLGRESRLLEREASRPLQTGQIRTAALSHSDSGLPHPPRLLSVT